MKLELNKSIYDHKETILVNIKSRVNLNWHQIFPSWYIEANRDLSHIKTLIEDKYRVNVPFWLVALLCSVLSPANKWDTNKKDILSLFDRYFIESSNPSFFTYGANVVKGLAILEDYLNSYRPELKSLNNYLEGLNQEYYVKKYLKTPKVYDFFYSLLLSKKHFVIDRHMMTIAGIDSKGKFPTKKQYEFLRDCFLEVYQTENLDSRFKSKSFFQAWLWVCYQYNFKGISHY
jgi:hypothetical protein